MPKKRKGRRSKDALEQTLRFLAEDRQGRPTSVSEIAAALGISPAAAGERGKRLTLRGQAQRIKRGMFSAVPVGPASRTTLSDLLDHLRREREQLDAKIVRVQETLQIHTEWVGSRP